MKTYRKILLPVLLLLLIGGGIWWYLSTRKIEEKRILTLYGNVDIRDAALAFREQERIREVLVEEGDQVVAGQLLARQDPMRLRAQIEQMTGQLEAGQAVADRLLAGTRRQEIERARADAEAAQVRYKNADRTLQRLEETAVVGAISRQGLDDARRARNVADAELKASREALDLALVGPRKEEIAEALANVRSLQAQLELLGIRLAELDLKSPAPGIIRSRLQEPGEMGDPGQPVVSLSLTDPKWVRAWVPEPSLGRIKPGMEAGVISDSFPDQTFSGWVGFISPEAEFTPKSVETTDLRTKLVYEVRVYVRDPDNRLRLGMPVTVRIETDGDKAVAGNQAKPGSGKRSDAVKKPESPKKPLKQNPY